ncbi:MAG: type III pantothenate kinase [Rikenellaceae bacterium]
MRNLVLDIGNTYYKLFVFEDSRVVERRKFSRLLVSDLVSLHEQYHFQAAILSTTRESEPEIVEWLERTIPHFEVFRSGITPIPLVNNYATPTTLGADRLAAAIAAAADYPNQELMIIDLGTAITIDFVSKQGVYLGGNISLGYSSRLIALHDQTGRLPLLKTPTESHPDLIGNSTNTAMEHGVFNSVLYELEGYISRNPKKIIIFTGGEAKYFVKLIKSTIFVDYQLVPRGLNLVIEYNYNRNEV